jgi:mannose/fructose/N-acetylgalactosamine-specific phosphotransferase system component IIC
MNARNITRPGTTLFIIFGFILAIYLKLPIIIVAFIAVLIGFYPMFKKQTEAAIITPAGIPNMEAKPGDQEEDF